MSAVASIRPLHASSGGTTIAVPAGTVLDKNGNIIKLPNGSAGGTIATMLERFLKLKK